MREETMNRMIERLSTTILDATITNRTTENSFFYSERGNFLKCQLVFSGEETDDVESFIDAVTTYKECAQVNEINALKGISILLKGKASTWYLGVKAKLSKWEDLISELRKAFGRKAARYEILQEIFKRVQGDNESIDIFR